MPTPLNFFSTSLMLKKNKLECFFPPRLQPSKSLVDKARSLPIESSIEHLTLPHLALPLLALSWLASPHLTSPHLTSPHLTSPHLTSPHLTSPRLASPHLTSPHLTSPHLTSPHLTSPHLTSSGLALPCLTSLNQPNLTYLLQWKWKGSQGNVFKMKIMKK